MHFIFLFLGLLVLNFNLCAQSVPCQKNQKGHLLFLVQQGKHEQALKIYQNDYQDKDQHDFDLLHQMGLGILDYGFKQKDPECQLLALYGASISAYEEAYHILEESTKNAQPQIQLIGLHALAKFQNDRADQLIVRALGSPFLPLRYEAALLLCQKNHPQAALQTESLMYKTPLELWSVFPQLFALIHNERASKILRKLLNHSSKDIRLATIISIGKNQREEFVDFIRQQLPHQQFAQQEACAYVLGELKDELAIPKLKALTRSQYSAVALAAAYSLYQMDIKEGEETILSFVKQGDLFAISLLGKMNKGSDLLVEILNSTSNEQVRFNCLIALIEQHHPQGIERANQILIGDKKDLGFTQLTSSGQTLTAWKVTSSASGQFQDNFQAYEENLRLKHTLLKKVREGSEPRLIELAHDIFNQQQKGLIPEVVEHLQELENQAAIACLKAHQQQLGAPFVRTYCNLGLYRLQETGPYEDLLHEWVKKESQSQLIQLKEVDPWTMNVDTYDLSPEEKSKVFIEVCEAIAINQGSKSVETLIELIATGHSKNKYVLAGLLIRATN